VAVAVAGTIAATATSAALANVATLRRSTVHIYLSSVVFPNELRSMIDTDTCVTLPLDNDRPTAGEGRMPRFYDAMPTDWISPGESASVTVDGFPVAVANVDGEFFAFQNLCPHQGTTLGGRPVEEDCAISCPQHGSRYDVRTGRCVKEAPDGFNQDLMTFRTQVVDDVVQVEV
jgi:3-phenylpropionate/trans-cinnamate dioxygenase ferredoxin subunit